jgi:prolyl 4-hydroxylase
MLLPSPLEKTVEAKRGRVLVWPSVLDQDPNLKDDRTHHQALPVIKGIKYGANSWVHLRDFKAPFEKSCI